MTQLEIDHQTAQKLEQLSQQAQKTVDEVLLLLLNNYGQALIEAEESRAVEANEVWTEAELAELLAPKKPMTGRQIVQAGLLGGWKDMGIEDSVEWLEEQRAQRRKKYQW